MTNREKLYEIAGRLGADADLAVIRAALLALIRVLLGVAVEPLVVPPAAPARVGITEAVDDILRERDAMVARSRRGIQRDDEKTPEDWAASLRKVSDPAHPIVSYDAPWTLRHMWVKVGAVALRAVESIDRARARKETNAEAVSETMFSGPGRS